MNTFIFKLIKADNDNSECIQYLGRPMSWEEVFTLHPLKHSAHKEEIKNFYRLLSREINKNNPKISKQSTWKKIQALALNSAADANTYIEIVKNTVLHSKQDLTEIAHWFESARIASQILYNPKPAQYKSLYNELSDIQKLTVASLGVNSTTAETIDTLVSFIGLEQAVLALAYSNVNLKNKKQKNAFLTKIQSLAIKQNDKTLENFSFDAQKLASQIQNLRMKAVNMELISQYFCIEAEKITYKSYLNGTLLGSFTVREALKSQQIENTLKAWSVSSKIQQDTAIVNNILQQVNMLPTPLKENIFSWIENQRIKAKVKNPVWEYMLLQKLLPEDMPQLETHLQQNRQSRKSKI